MRFTYRCTEDHRYEGEFAPGAAPDVYVCACGLTGARDYSSDFASQVVSTGDPFRAYHLSTAKDRASGEQQRPIGGPTDNFERRRDERERGIQYVGNDTSGMTAAARRGIEQAKAKT